MFDLRIKTEQGELQGCRKTTKEGFEYNAYLGIPYAKPPLGDLRFKSPLPPNKWDGVRDATSYGNSAVQSDALLRKMCIGDEDCLFLNVYTPSSTSKSSKLPVMFWIHGGGFMAGSGNSDMYGPDFLIEYDVVLVTINYRLGPFGFLCLNMPEVPGNAGMKDQIMALKWVQKNIEYFGGNADNVTIFGESAGSISVNHLILSPMAKGIFHRAILQSGTSLSMCSIQANPENNAFDLAKNLGLDTQDKRKAFEFLQKASAEELMEGAGGFTLSFHDCYTYLPVVEKEFTDVEPFLSNDPLKLIEIGDFNRVPIICGFNSKESILLFSKEMKNSPNIHSIDSARKYIQQLLSSFRNKYAFENESIIIDQIEKFYFKSDDSAEEDFIEVGGDLFASIDTDIIVRKMSKYCESLYFYYFCYNGSLNSFKGLVKIPYDGACHGDELGYLFKSIIPSSAIPSTTDIITKKRMLEMWTNFAKHGNPTLECTETLNTTWKPARDAEMNCLQIDKDLKMIVSPRQQAIDFWKNLFAFQ